MKKITKILALTLALVMLALSCTSCGNLFDSSIFISKKEKEQMAENIENNTIVEYAYRNKSDKAIRPRTVGKENITEKTLYTDIVSCVTNSKEMNATFIISGLSADAYVLDSEYNINIPIERALSIILPYEIKSAVSASAIETIISEDKKTVTLIYSYEYATKINEVCAAVYDEIVIKYKK